MLKYAALSPHPPVIIPLIGGDRLDDIKPTVDAMQKMAQNLVASQPEAVVFLTPHGNVFSDCISCLGMSQLYGDFGNFGRKDISFTSYNDLELLEEISTLSVEKDIEFIILNEEIAQQNRLNAQLDHGILVPLYYLREAGLKEDIPIIPISIGYLPILTLYSFGKVIQEAANNLGKSIALVASGDMSHHLKNDAPYTYHPDGPLFDKLIKEYLQKGDVEAILSMPESLRQNAGECGYRSIVIMTGTMDSYEINPHIYAYEGPFGVGYLTAGFTLGNKKTSYLDRLIESKVKEIKDRRKKESLPVKWARMVLENYVRDGIKPDLPPELQELKEKQAAVFVTLKKDGNLRGCIGTILPSYPNMAEELANNAVSAGVNDTRFLPVGEKELNQLVYSVDILSLPEACSSAELDPTNYGVIVSKGNKRGLLLPALEGIETVEQQLSIVLEKAGINPNEDYKIERFKVERFY